MNHSPYLLPKFIFKRQLTRMRAVKQQVVINLFLAYSDDSPLSPPCPLSLCGLCQAWCKQVNFILPLDIQNYILACQLNTMHWAWSTFVNLWTLNLLVIITTWIILYGTHIYNKDKTHQVSGGKKIFLYFKNIHKYLGMPTLPPPPAHLAGGLDLPVWVVSFCR